MDVYMGTLAKELPGYLIKDIDVDGLPLPEKRERVIILGSRNDASFPADVWKEQIQALAAACGSMPVHAMTSMIPKPDKKPEADAKVDWKNESLYHQYFAKALDKAVTSKKLPADAMPMDLAQRSSRRLSLQWLSPWQQANADVIEMCVARIAEAVPADRRSNVRPLADISQCPGRGHYSLFSTWSTLTTSTRILSYETGQVLPAYVHLRPPACKMFKILGLCRLVTQSSCLVRM